MKIHSLVFLALLSFFHSAYGSFITIQEIEAIRPYIDTDTLIIFDIDNTLLQAQQELGSDEWFSFMCKKYEIKTVLPLYYAIQHAHDLSLIEDSAPHLINDIKKLGVSVIALTARSLPLVDRTHEQLKIAGIHFDDNPPHHTDIAFYFNDHGIYKNGILFCANNCKGDILDAFLQETGLRPRRIIMIDDKEKYLYAIKEKLSTSGIEFIGFHYTRLHHKATSFNTEAAHNQLVAFLDRTNIHFAL